MMAAYKQTTASIEGGGGGGGEPQKETKTTTTISSSEMTSDVEYGILTDHARRKSRSHSLKDCHVQFERVFVEEGKSEEAAVTATCRGENNVEVQLGFLQFMHKYDVNFILDHGGTSSSSSSSSSAPGWMSSGCGTSRSPLNNNAKVISVEPHGDGSTSKLDIKMEVYVATDKVLFEKCPLENGEKTLTLNLHAKVLSKDKGTPLLKKGIHCIEHYLDEESEYGS